MNTVVKNGRLHMVDENGVETPIPLSMDEARAMKSSRLERVEQAEALCPAADNACEAMSMECD